MIKWFGKWTDHVGEGWAREKCENKRETSVRISFLFFPSYHAFIFLDSN
jgi:hypothetical protein